MRIGLLGGVAVTGGEPTETVEGAHLGGRRAHLLVAALALEPGPMAADRLASLIWDEPPSTWRVAVRGLVADLRKRLAEIGSDVVVTTPTGYRLAAGVTTDVAELEATVATAAGLRATGRWHALVSRLGPAPTLDPADLAAGLDAAWLDPHRARLRETVLQAGLLATAAYGELDDHPAAVALGRHLVAAHPLDERVHRALISALAAAGDRSAAVQAFEACRSLLTEELGVDPSADTVATYLHVLETAEPTGPARLPKSGTSFVGRESDLRRLASAASRPGLVTVTGPGGVGKSRLAQEVAARAVDLPGGRHWVSLAHVAEDALVDATVAMTLGLPASGDEPARTVARHLARLGRTVVVLDGCEAVRDGAASMAHSLLEGAPDTTVVVTSRVALGLSEERVIVLAPLALPEDATPDELAASEPVRLIADRISEYGGELVVDADLASYLDALCRHCAGLPLALELVAAQLTAMSPADVVEHLDEMAAGSVDAVRQVAEASHALLQPDEAAVFRRMSVLEGAADLIAVRAVSAGDDVAAVRVVRLLRELGDRNLVTAHRSGSRWTYEQDDDLHRFARQHLVAAGEEREAYLRLADLVQSTLPDDPRSPPAPFAESVSALLPSVRGLLGAGVAGTADRTRCLEVAFRLHRYWAATNVGEGRFWLSRLLADRGDEDEQWAGYATYALGYLNYWAGEDTAAVPQLERAIELLADVDSAYVARAQIFLAGILDDLDRGPAAVALVRQAIESASGHGIDLRVSAAMGLGSVLGERGDPEAAAYAEAALDLCESGGSAEQLAASLPTASMVAWQVGALDRVRRWVERAMPMHTEQRRIARVVLLQVACGLHLVDGDLDAAVEVGRSADLEGTELGVERELPLVRSLLALALLARGDLDEAHDRARAAVTAAVALTYQFPLASALEAAALVATARGVPAGEVAPWVATAAQIRVQGDRPVPALLAARVALLRDSLPASDPLPIPTVVAAVLAR
ncbi:MAG TPA: BTAD domain-containing putative transcriptional regulator [Nocardioides sp.]|uniref:ATP-binding protein n=1 Tax=Nocardioides sp. TaxID=35761 RepID=UPI002E37DDB8|nr:BTAD domain-containing putative transcriptional regulator [Nocardioides sp.]HEX3930967.1 BTAD domain-containing putative transcriptional regulator [Nocardioides sp.]